MNSRTNQCELRVKVRALLQLALSPYKTQRLLTDRSFTFLYKVKIVTYLGIIFGLRTRFFKNSLSSIS